MNAPLFFSTSRFPRGSRSNSFSIYKLCRILFSFLSFARKPNKVREATLLRLNWLEKKAKVSFARAKKNNGELDADCLSGPKPARISILPSSRAPASFEAF